MTTWTRPPILTDAEAGEVEVFEGSTFVKRGRGRPPTGNAKELVSLRLDRDVLAKLREAGPGWQSQVNVLLRRVLGLDARPAATMTDSVSPFEERVVFAREMTEVPVVYATDQVGEWEMAQIAKLAGDRPDMIPGSLPPLSGRLVKKQD